VWSVELSCIKFTYLCLVLMMFIKKKPLSPPALLAAEVVPIATKTLKLGNCIVLLLQLNSTLINTCWPSKKYNFTRESFQTNINKAKRLEVEQRLVRLTSNCFAFHNSWFAMHESLRLHWYTIWHISRKEHKSSFQTTKEFYLVCLFSFRLVSRLAAKSCVQNLKMVCSILSEVWLTQQCVG